MLAWHTEQIATSSGRAKVEAAGGMVRVWRMMESLRRSHYIKRHELEAEVFGAYSSELRGYLEHNVIRFAIRPYLWQVEAGPIKLGSLK
jgi:hypothetical protein